MGWIGWPRAIGSVIGLDIGHTGVRACQLTGGEGRYTIAHHAQCSSSFRPDSTCTERVSSCLVQARFRGRHAVTALHTPDVMFHSLELPNVDPATLESVVRFEMDRLMTEADQATEIGYWHLPPSKTSAPNAVGVTARSEVVVGAMAACDRAGAFCRGVDTGATALARFGTLLQPWSDGPVWGLLDLGSRQSRLVLCVDDVPVLVRTAGAGGQTWTEHIAEALQISQETAEVQKCDHGIATTARGRRSATDDAVPRDELGGLLLGILRTDLHDLIVEIKRSYEYVLSCYPDRSAGDLILVGGGARMKNMASFLGDKLGIPVRRASGYLDEKSCRLKASSLEDGQLERLAVAVGLAVRS